MPQLTYPNQRMVKIHREPAKVDFLGILNKNWQAAAKDLRPHAFVLYLYLASNADDYKLALSPAAIRTAIGMPRSTYNDQIQKLIDKGYLVPSHGNNYDFYEVPKPREEKQDNQPSDDNNNENELSADVNDITAVVKSSSTQNREINNSTTSINISNSPIIEKPKERVITISRPQAEGKQRPKPVEMTMQDFVF